MRDTHFITSILALKAWQDGKDEGLSAMMAISFVVRNRVRAGWYGGNWLEVLAHMPDVAAKLEPPTNELPDTRNYAFLQFMQIVDGIFSGATEDDITIKKDGEWRQVLSMAPPVVMYYARLDQITNPWFLQNIVRKPDQHQRISQVGQLFFFT